MPKINGVKAKAAQRTRGESKPPKLAVSPGELDGQYLLSLMAPSQWNMLASAFDNVSFPTTSVEDVLVVRTFLRVLIATREFQAAIQPVEG